MNTRDRRTERGSSTTRFLALLVVLSTLVLYLWALANRDGTMTTTETSYDEAVQGPSRTSSPLAPEHSSDSELRREQATRAEPTRDPTESGHELRGRCVDAHKNPLPGCKVVVNVKPQDGASTRLDTLSGQDGRFRLRYADDLTGQFMLEVRNQGFTTRLGTIQRRTGEVTDLGTIYLFRCVRVRGRVINSSGDPIANALLVLKSERGEFSDELSPSFAFLTSARSDAQGKFEVARPIRCAEWDLLVRGSGITDWSPKTVQLARGEQVRFLTISASTAPAISGVIKDDQGLPAIGIRIRAYYEPNDRPASEYGTSNGSGKFTLHPLASSTTSPRTVTLVSEHEDYESSRWKSVAWGATDVELQVVRAPSLEVAAYGPDGQPLERYGASLTSDQHVIEMSPFASRSDGRMVLRGKRTGTGYLRIVPEDRTLSPLGPVEVQLGRSSSPVVVRIGKARSVKVSVRSSARTLAGAKVAVIEVPSGLTCTTSTLVASGSRPSLIPSRGRPICWYEATTTPRGDCMVRVPLAGRRYVVRVRAENHIGVVQDLGPQELQSGEIQVVLPKAGRLIGTLSDPLSSAPESGLLLRRSSTTFPQQGFLKLQGPLSFEINPAPLGLWELVYSTRRSTRTLATVEIRADEPVKIRLDTSALRH